MLLFLIGFMGSGKSFTGRRLAALTGWEFYDLDAMIESVEGQTVAGIFAQRGETFFRELEAKTLRDCKSLAPAIISCGGGTPCFYENMAWMNTHGTTVWLNPPLDLLYQRLLRKPHKRPLLTGLETEEDWMAFLRHKMEERRPFYQQAQHIIHQKTDEEDAAAEVYRIVFGGES
jgi:shikimate kinase